MEQRKLTCCGEIEMKTATLGKPGAVIIYEADNTHTLQASHFVSRSVSKPTAHMEAWGDMGYNAQSSIFYKCYIENN